MDGAFGPQGVHGSTGTEPRDGAKDAVPQARVRLSVASVTPRPSAQGLDAPGYYPGLLYKITAECEYEEGCALLLTVEEGGREDSAKSKQRGEFEYDAEVIRAAGYVLPEGDFEVVQPCQGAPNAIAATHAALARAYTFYWRAPDGLSYADYEVRATAVLECGTAATCATSPAGAEAGCGAELAVVALPSIPRCGDGFKDPLEACDDGNSESGDGCSDLCEVEVGFTCLVPDANFTGTTECTFAQVVLDPPGITVVEGSPFTYTVGLSTWLCTDCQGGQPADMTVTIDSIEDEDGNMLPAKAIWELTEADAQELGYAASQASSVGLSATGDFSTPQVQLVSFRSRDNEKAEGTRTLYVTHRVETTDPTFRVADPPKLAVTLLDNDSPGLKPTVAGNSSRLRLTEGGDSSSAATYTLQLLTRPLGGSEAMVTVSVVGEPAGQIATTPSALVFTDGTWDKPQTVTVRAVDDSVLEPTMEVRILHTMASNNDEEGYNTQETPLVLYADIEDNDVAGVIVDPVEINVFEGKQPGTAYTIKLRARPSVPVTLTLSAKSQGVATEEIVVRPTTILFDQSNFGTGQEVFVRGVDNMVVDAARQYTVSHAIETEEPLYQGLTVPDVTVTLLNDDIASIEYPTAINAVEGTPSSFYLSFTSQPLDNVTLSFTASRDRQLLLNGCDGGSGYVQADECQVLVMPGAWSQRRQFGVKVATDDLLDKGNYEMSLNLRAESTDLNFNFSPKPIAVEVFDNDHAEVLVEGTTALNEGGEGGSVDVKLRSKPTGKVIVDMRPSAGLRLLDRRVTFSQSDYDEPQTVRFEAVDDNAVERLHTEQIIFGVTSNDTIYDELVVPSWLVTITDNDAEELTAPVERWGGVVCLTQPCDVVAVTVPPGASATEVDVTVAERSPPPRNEGQLAPRELGGGRRASGVYAFSATVANETADARRLLSERLLATFNPPVQIAVAYSAEAVAEPAAEGREVTFFARLEAVGGEAATAYAPVEGGIFNSGIAHLSLASLGGACGGGGGALCALQVYVGVNEDSSPSPPAMPPPSPSAVEGCAGGSGDDTTLLGVIGGLGGLVLILFVQLVKARAAADQREAEAVVEAIAALEAEGRLRNPDEDPDVEKQPEFRASNGRLMRKVDDPRGMYGKPRAPAPPDVPRLPSAPRGGGARIVPGTASGGLASP